MSITLSDLANTSIGKEVTGTISKMTGVNISGIFGSAGSGVINKFQFLPVPEEEYPHKMVFWINALDIGKFKPSAKEINTKDSPVISSGETSSTFSKYEKVGKALVPKLESVTKVIDKGINVVKDTVNSVTGEQRDKTNDNYVTNLMKEVVNNIPKLNRTNTCIVLPVPNQLNTDLNIDWQNAEGGTIGNIVSLADYSLNQGGSFAPALTSILGREAIKFVTNVASSFGAQGGEVLVDQLTKKVSNPRPEVLFKGVGFRQFAFNWTLVASSSKEAKAIWDIYQAFKFASLPELDKDTAGAFMIYPYNVDIEIHSNGKPNDWLFKTSTCAINNISINYSEGGRVAFFDMIDSSEMHGCAPVGVNLTIGLQEMEIMTKNRLLTSHVNKSPDSIPFMQGNYGQGSGKGVF